LVLFYQEKSTNDITIDTAATPDEVPSITIDTAATPDEVPSTTVETAASPDEVPSITHASPVRITESAPFRLFRVINYKQSDKRE
jgi:hypothetical protein